MLSWNVGLLNALNKKNVYSYQWQQRASAQGVFAFAEQKPVAALSGRVRQVRLLNR
jgi:hypothetical protein